MKIVLDSKLAQTAVVVSYAAMCGALVTFYGYAMKQREKRSDALDAAVAGLEGWAKGYKDGYNVAVRSIKHNLDAGVDADFREMD